jgi:hypothetical protein
MRNGLQNLNSPAAPLSFSGRVSIYAAARQKPNDAKYKYRSAKKLLPGMRFITGRRQTKNHKIQNVITECFRHVRTAVDISAVMSTKLTMELVSIIDCSVNEAVLLTKVFR